MNNRKIIPLSDIIISEGFQKQNPKVGKISRCYDYLLKNGKFDRDIILNKNGVLKDGYCAFLICRMVGVKDVEVVTV